MSSSKNAPTPNQVSNFPVDHDWLALADPEEILEPDLKIIDAHHHLLDRPEGRYMVPDMLDDMAQGHNVIGTVFVEGGNFFLRPYGPEHLRVVGETEIVASMTAHDPRIAAGIVSYADFFLGAGVEDVLDQHTELGQGRFVGARQLTIWDDDPTVQMSQAFPRKALGPGMMEDPAFREGYKKLGPRGLIFDATAFHTQIPELYDLAKASPDVGLIIDHLGCIVRVGPYAGKDDEIFASWTADLKRIAELDNVTIKIGGLGMRMYGFNLRELSKPPSSKHLAELWKPYVETAIEIFGPERAMFESNFPVDKGYFSFGTCWNAFKRITAGASATDKAALYAETAIKVYDLNL